MKIKPLEGHPQAQLDVLAHVGGVVAKAVEVIAVLAVEEVAGRQAQVEYLVAGVQQPHRTASAMRADAGRLFEMRMGETGRRRSS